jgi:VWFA-related protein
MHQISGFGIPRAEDVEFFRGDGGVMAPLKRNPVGNHRTGNQPWRSIAPTTLLALAMASPILALHAQSGGAPAQSQPPAKTQSAQDIPDAPSAVQPPLPKPAFPPDSANASQPDQGSRDSAQPPDDGKPALPPVETLAPGASPRNQISPKDDLYKISVSTSFVQIPVMVKDSDGRRVDGLLPKDFSVTENGKPQTLSYFTSDPFQLSVAVLIDNGMPDVALQKVNQTYASLVGAFSPYDEVALYTYSSTVSQVTDFTARAEKLTAVLNEIKLVRGASGPPVLGGPFSGGPTVNGAPVGGPTIQPVNTPSREAHVLNDAILRAALDLSKRDRIRRKVIFVISDGRELGSQASYRDVLKVLQTRDIQVKAVVVDSGALPVFRQVEKIHLKGQGYSNILPKYTVATGGGAPLDELTRNAMEDAYGQITSEARNQYTLGYVPKPVTGGSPYREIEVVVFRKGLKVSAKNGYYPTPKHGAPAGGSPE